MLNFPNRFAACREGCPTLPRAVTVSDDSAEVTLGDVFEQHSLEQQQQQQQHDAATQPQLQQQEDHSAAAAAAVAVAAASCSPSAFTALAIHDNSRDSSSITGKNGSSSGCQTRRRVAPSATTAYMTQSILPPHANTLGITFGGQVTNGCNWCRCRCRCKPPVWTASGGRAQPVALL